MMDRKMTRRELLNNLKLLLFSLLSYPFDGVAWAEKGEIGKTKAKNQGRSLDMEKPFFDLKKLGYVLVTPSGPEDGGDFGPKTAGTKTSGIQEALDYAKANKRDVYIAGGGLTEAFKGGVGYQLEETLRIPWNQNWRLDGGEYWLSYTQESGDAVVIDSQMNCRIKLGLVVNTRSDGAVVRMCPTSKGPDNLCCIVASTFEFNGMVGAGDVWGREGAKQKSTGLLMDAKSGGISGNKILIQEINACDLGIHITQGCHTNLLYATWIHLTNLGIKIGDAKAPNVSEHIIQAGISGDLPKTTGVQIFGQRNFLTISAHGHDAGKNVIFEGPSRENLIIAVNLAEGITNNASIPTNRIIPTWPIGFSVATPPVPASGEEVVNRHPYTIEARIVTAGQVTEWIQTDANGVSQKFSGGLFTGHGFILQPGDKIGFSYTEPPTWRWRALS